MNCRGEMGGGEASEEAAVTVGGDRAWELRYCGSEGAEGSGYGARESGLESGWIGWNNSQELQGW